MKNLKNLRFEIWRDGAHKMMSIRADTGVGEKEKGLKYIWFVLSEAELREAVLSRKFQHSIRDGYHMVTVSGDEWLFTDQDYGLRHRTGVYEVPYVRVIFPSTFMRALYRYAAQVWKTLPDAGPRTVLEISPERAERICQLYGYGKGQAVVCPRGGWEGYKSRESMEAWMRNAEASPKFREMEDRLLSIARNSTRGFHQKARVEIFMEDETSFIWTALDNKGRCVMWGGLVNHGHRRGEHDWSIHT